LKKYRFFRKKNITTKCAIKLSARVSTGNPEPDWSIFTENLMVDTLAIANIVYCELQTNKMIFLTASVFNESI
jgi:hypothetical protein